jgi:UDP-N-acetylglucosamine 1-carboxyvinyltransferase
LSELSDGAIRATARSGLRGADILLPQPSVGATENLLLAAVLARGTTFIRNAAREPEIADFAACLALMGAMISGIGTEVLTIVGDAQLSGAVHGVMPDRIELGTLACAAAITDGELLLKHGRLDLLGAAFESRSLRRRVRSHQCPAAQRRRQRAAPRARNQREANAP